MHSNDWLALAAKNQSSQSQHCVVIQAPNKVSWQAIEHNVQCTHNNSAFIGAITATNTCI
jgi:hypothetical protein